MNRSLSTIVVCAVAFGICFPGAIGAGTGRKRPALNLLFLADPPVRVEIHLDLNGEDFVAFWSETFSRLFRFHDFDSDGRLDDSELPTVPAAVALRHAMANGFTPPTGASPRMADVDRDGDQAVDEAELASFYRAAGIGEVHVGAGVLPATRRLRAALTQRLDRDGDGAVGKAEWLGAMNSLAALDRNDDELIGAGELVPGTVYPGVAGTILLSPGTLPAAEPKPIIPVAILPADGADRPWATALAEGLPAVTRAALLAAGDAPPATSWKIAIPSPGNDRVLLRSAKLRLDGWVASGKALAYHAAAKKSLEASFAKYTGRLGDEKDAKQADDELDWLVVRADRNRSGVLEPDEFSRWLAVQERVVRGHILLTVFDAADGLFEILDEDHDGGLSPRELTTAWSRLDDAGLTVGETLAAGPLPRVVLMAVSQGYPDGYRRDSRGGPAWLRAMDRNRDGEVSRREFVGNDEDFASLDADRDGFIGFGEAEGHEKH